jgi:hypothetical protein
VFYIAIVCFCRAHVEYAISALVRLSHCLIPSVYERVCGICAGPGTFGCLFDFRAICKQTLSRGGRSLDVQGYHQPRLPGTRATFHLGITKRIRPTSILICHNNVSREISLLQLRPEPDYPLRPSPINNKPNMPLCIPSSSSKTSSSPYDPTNKSNRISDGGYPHGPANGGGMMSGSAGRTKKPVGRAALRWAMLEWVGSRSRLTSL